MNHAQCVFMGVLYACTYIYIHTVLNVLNVSLCMATYTHALYVLMNCIYSESYVVVIIWGL